MGVTGGADTLVGSDRIPGATGIDDGALTPGGTGNELGVIAGLLLLVLLLVVLLVLVLLVLALLVLVVLL